MVGRQAHGPARYIHPNGESKPLKYLFNVPDADLAARIIFIRRQNCVANRKFFYQFMAGRRQQGRTFRETCGLNGSGCCGLGELRGGKTFNRLWQCIQPIFETYFRIKRNLRTFRKRKL